MQYLFAFIVFVIFIYFVGFHGFRFLCDLGPKTARRWSPKTISVVLPCAEEIDHVGGFEARNSNDFASF